MNHDDELLHSLSPTFSPGHLGSTHKEAHLSHEVDNETRVSNCFLFLFLRIFFFSWRKKPLEASGAEREIFDQNCLFAAFASYPVYIILFLFPDTIFFLSLYNSPLYLFLTAKLFFYSLPVLVSFILPLFVKEAQASRAKHMMDGKAKHENLFVDFYRFFSLRDGCMDG